MESTDNSAMARANSSMAARARTRASLPLGYCFRPSEEEIVVHFLYKKMKGTLQDCGEIIDCDIYVEEEYWTTLFELQQPDSFMNEDDKAVMYFFTKLKKKGTEKGKRWDRVTKSGTWRTQRDDKIYWGCNRHVVGSKRSFKFVPNNKQETRMRGWIMHEFRVDGQLLQRIKDCKDKDYVVCRIKKDRETKKMMKDSSSSSSSCNINHEHDHAAAVAVDGPEKWVKLKQLEHMLLDEEVAADDQDGSGATPTSVLQQQNMEFGEAPLALKYNGDHDQHCMQQLMDLMNPSYQEMMMMVNPTVAAADDQEQLVFNNDNDVYTQCLAKEDHQATTSDDWSWSIDEYDMAGAAAYKDGQQDNTMFSLEELMINGTYSLGKL